MKTKVKNTIEVSDDEFCAVFYAMTRLARIGKVDTPLMLDRDDKTIARKHYKTLLGLLDKLKITEEK